MFTMKKLRSVNLRVWSVICAAGLLIIGCHAQSKVKNPPTKTKASVANQKTTSQSSKIKFSSVYTKLDSKTCQPVSKPESESDEVADICEGYKNYKIFVSHHGTATRIYIGTEITKDADAWDASVLPSFIANSAGDGQTIEWRLADGEPFACIVRAEYDKSIINSDDKGIANEFVVKNLKGFAPLNAKIDAQKNKRANDEARRRADSAYKKL